MRLPTPARDGIDTLLEAGRLAAARLACTAALNDSPGDANLWMLLASATYRLGSYSEALQALDRCLALAPSRIEARVARASTLDALGRLPEAIAELRHCVAESPASAHLLAMLADCEERAGHVTQALALLNAALEADPGHRAARLNRGTLRLASNEAEAALEDFEALASTWSDPVVHVNRAQALFALWRDDEALTAAESALAIDPRNVLAQINRGYALAALGRTAESEQVLRTARQQGPAEFARITGTPGYDAWTECPPEPTTIAMFRAVQSQQVCDWRRRDAAAAMIRALPSHVLGSLLARRHALPAFDFVAFGLSANEQLDVARHLANGYPSAPRHATPPPTAGRVRIGFLSPDFHPHPTAWLLRQLLRRLDRTRFEVVAFPLNPERGEPLRAKLLAEADRAPDLSALDDAQAADAIAREGIDVLVECAGYCLGARPALLAHRPAPVQASYLGMPATLGLECIDYRLSDAACTPEPQQANWAERLVLMPETHLVYDPPELPAEPPTRASLGLPERAFVFCCLSNPLKIEPGIFGVWMRILAACPESVLWLHAAQDLARDNLRAAAHAAGIDRARLCFAPRRARAEFVAAAGCADLFLDTYHFGAHTTAMDVLWGGLPILTCPGETMASRLAASLMLAARIPELVVPDLEAYAATAIRLAHDRPALAALRDRVAAARTQAPIFDTAARVKAFEDAILAMHRRRLAGLPPATLVYRPEYGAYFSAGASAA